MGENEFRLWYVDSQKNKSGVFILYLKNKRKFQTFMSAIRKFRDPGKTKGKFDKSKIIRLFLSELNFE